MEKWEKELRMLLKRHGIVLETKFYISQKTTRIIAFCAYTIVGPIIGGFFGLAGGFVHLVSNECTWPEHGFWLHVVAVVVSLSLSLWIDKKFLRGEIAFEELRQLWSAN